MLKLFYLKFIQLLLLIKMYYKMFGIILILFSKLNLLRYDNMSIHIIQEHNKVIHHHSIMITRIQSRFMATCIGE